jgi:5-methylcytosine-specific restriction endonuclease McrA
MIRRSKKAKQRWSIVKQLDALARERCFERDGHKCVRCGSDKVQWCHIIGRRHKSTRWELDNVLSMDAGCHRWWHEYPLLSGPWFKKNWPERSENIIRLYNAGGKVDLKGLLATLQDSQSDDLPPGRDLVYEPIKDVDTPF